MTALFLTLACCVGVQLIAYEWQLRRVRSLALLTELFAIGAGLLNYFVSSKYVPVVVPPR